MEDFKTIKEELDSLYDSNRYLQDYIIYLEKMILNEKFSEEHGRLREKFYQITKIINVKEKNDTRYK